MRKVELMIGLKIPAMVSLFVATFIDFGIGRAVQFSLSDPVCQRIVEVERVDIEFAGDVFDTVGAQDVDGEASEAGEVCRLDAGSAGVFAERDVADVMASVLDAPVASDRLAECLGAEGDLTGVEGDFLGFVPEAG